MTIVAYVILVAIAIYVIYLLTRKKEVVGEVGQAISEVKAEENKVATTFESDKAEVVTEVKKIDTAL